MLASFEKVRSESSLFGGLLKKASNAYLLELKVRWVIVKLTMTIEFARQSILHLLLTNRRL